MTFVLSSWESIFDVANRYFKRDLPPYYDEEIHNYILLDIIGRVIGLPSFPFTITQITLPEPLWIIPGNRIFISKPMVAHYLNLPVELPRHTIREVEKFDALRSFNLIKVNRPNLTNGSGDPSCGNNSAMTISKEVFFPWKHNNLVASGVDQGTMSMFQTNSFCQKTPSNVTCNKLKRRLNSYNSPSNVEYANDSIVNSKVMKNLNKNKVFKKLDTRARNSNAVDIDTESSEEDDEGESNENSKHRKMLDKMFGNTQCATQHNINIQQRLNELEFVNRCRARNSKNMGYFFNWQNNDIRSNTSTAPRSFEIMSDSNIVAFTIIIRIVDMVSHFQQHLINNQYYASHDNFHEIEIADMRSYLTMLRNRQNLINNLEQEIYEGEYDRFVDNCMEKSQDELLLRDRNLKIASMLSKNSDIDPSFDRRLDKVYEQLNEECLKKTTKPKNKNKVNSKNPFEIPEGFKTYHDK